MYMQLKQLIIILSASMLLLSTPLTAGDDHGHVFNFDAVDWQETGLDGVQMALLWGNEEDYSAIYAFKIQPGVTIPPHTHSNDYWGIAVQGTWAHIDADGTEVQTGQEAYTLIKAGDIHSDKCVGPDVCINVLDFDGARNITFIE